VAVGLALLGLVTVQACDGAEDDDDAGACGPARATVVAVVDGDTVDLDSGERVRYLMVDTNEITGGKDECYGAEARSFNESLVLGQAVELTYDVQCTDRFGRLLAYVAVQGREVNRLLVDRGYACVLEIPPNGADRSSEFAMAQNLARSEGRGMWSACDPVPCAE